MRRLSGGRFLILTDEAHIRQAIEKRFEVLDKIREIKAENAAARPYRSAWHVVQNPCKKRNSGHVKLWRWPWGGAETKWQSSKKMIHMNSFGGLSKGVEKRDKVRTRVIAATLSDHIKEADNVLIMGHRFSDLDAMGAAVGLWSAITKALHKPAFVVVDRQQTLAGQIVERIDAQSGDRVVFLSAHGRHGTVIFSDAVNRSGHAFARFCGEPRTVESCQPCSCH